MLNAIFLSPIHEFDQMLNDIAGCYPHCPPAKPYFDEDSMKCVSKTMCGCYDDKGYHYRIGDKVSSPNCNTWYVSHRKYAFTQKALHRVKIYIYTTFGHAQY